MLEERQLLCAFSVGSSLDDLPGLVVVSEGNDVCPDESVVGVEIGGATRSSSLVAEFSLREALATVTANHNSELELVAVSRSNLAEDVIIVGGATGSVQKNGNSKPSLTAGSRYAGGAHGGVVTLRSGVTFAVGNSTLYNNTAEYDGGSNFSRDGKAQEFANTTIARNEAAIISDGGELNIILTENSITRFHNAIVAGNAAQSVVANIVGGSFQASRPYNVAGVGGDLLADDFDANFVLTEGDALGLVALGDYGDSTRTRRPLAGSDTTDLGGNSFGAQLDPHQRGLIQTIGRVDLDTFLVGGAAIKENVAGIDGGANSLCFVEIGAHAIIDSTTLVVDFASGSCDGIIIEDRGYLVSNSTCLVGVIGGVDGTQVDDGFSGMTGNASKAFIDTNGHIAGLIERIPPVVDIIDFASRSFFDLPCDGVALEGPITVTSHHRYFQTLDNEGDRDAAFYEMNLVPCLDDIALCENVSASAFTLIPGFNNDSHVASGVFEARLNTRDQTDFGGDIYLYSRRNGVNQIEEELEIDFDLGCSGRFEFELFRHDSAEVEPLLDQLNTVADYSAQFALLVSCNSPSLVNHFVSPNRTDYVESLVHVETLGAGRASIYLSNRDATNSLIGCITYNLGRADDQVTRTMCRQVRSEIPTEPQMLRGVLKCAIAIKHSGKPHLVLLWARFHVQKLVAGGKESIREMWAPPPRMFRTDRAHILLQLRGAKQRSTRCTGRGPFCRAVAGARSQLSEGAIDDANVNIGLVGGFSEFRQDALLTYSSSRQQIYHVDRRDAA